MAKPIKRHLKVGTAPEDDEDTLIVRMHPDDLPKGIKWNRYIHLHVRDGKISCKVRNNELAEIPHPRIHQININRALRNVLGIKSGTIYDFYVSKALILKAPYYVLKYHPYRAARRNMLLKIFGVIITVCIVIGAILYYFLGYN
jgi:hypothetical protein